MVRPVLKRQFGISTHLYHGQRLSRDHLLEIAAHGFEWVEVYATRTHFDYHNPAAVADLQQWIAEAGLRCARPSWRSTSRGGFRRRSWWRISACRAAGPDSNPAPATRARPRGAA